MEKEREKREFAQRKFTSRISTMKTVKLKKVEGTDNEYTTYVDHVPVPRGRQEGHSFAGGSSFTQMGIAEGQGPGGGGSTSHRQHKGQGPGQRSGGGAQGGRWWCRCGGLPTLTLTNRPLHLPNINPTLYCYSYSYIN